MFTKLASIGVAAAALVFSAGSQAYAGGCCRCAPAAAPATAPAQPSTASAKPRAYRSYSYSPSSPSRSYGSSGTRRSNRDPSFRGADSKIRGF